MENRLQRGGAQVLTSWKAMPYVSGEVSAALQTNFSHQILFLVLSFRSRRTLARSPQGTGVLGAEPLWLLRVFPSADNRGVIASCKDSILFIQSAGCILSKLLGSGFSSFSSVSRAPECTHLEEAPPSSCSIPVHVRLGIRRRSTALKS
jgi:hypothetical protein